MFEEHPLPIFVRNRQVPAIPTNAAGPGTESHCPLPLPEGKNVPHRAMGWGGEAHSQRLGQTLGPGPKVIKEGEVEVEEESKEKANR